MRRRRDVNRASPVCGRQPTMSPDDLARALLQPGRASIPYLDHYNPDRPLMLECFRPPAHYPDGLGDIGLMRDDIVRFLGPATRTSTVRPRTFRGTTPRWRRGQTGFFARSSTSTAVGRKPQSSACRAAGAALSCRASRMRGCGCRHSPAIIGSAPVVNSAPRGCSRRVAELYLASVCSDDQQAPRSSATPICASVPLLNQASPTSA